MGEKLLDLLERVGREVFAGDDLQSFLTDLTALRDGAAPAPAASSSTIDPQAVGEGLAGGVGDPAPPA